MSKSFTELVREMNRLEESRSRPHKHLPEKQLQTLHRIATERGDSARAAELDRELKERKTGKLRQKLPNSVTK